MCSNENLFTNRPPITYEVALTNSKLTIMTSGDSMIPENMSVSSTSMNNSTNNNHHNIPTGIIQPLDQYRLHLYNYALQAERLRLVHQSYTSPNPICAPGLGPYGPRWPYPMTLLQHRLQHDEPKPQHSYIGLIAMAILSSPETKLVLSDIYQYILDNYPYFRTRGPGWRNSIRHNLSLNDCFIKAGRSANGKGHYWAIHPANIDDFRKGDFRRRKAQRKVRKHMGLIVDDDGNDSPSPPPLTPPSAANIWQNAPLIFPTFPNKNSNISSSKKRQFDVASLLAPDEYPSSYKRPCISPVIPTRGGGGSSSSDDGGDVVTDDIDVVTSSDVIVKNNNNLDCCENHENRGPEDLRTSIDPAEVSNPNLNHFANMIGPWCCPMGLMNSNHHHHQTFEQQQQQQQLMAKAYYEQLSTQARTIQIGLYQQWQFQRRPLNNNLNHDQSGTINVGDDSDKETQ